MNYKTYLRSQILADVQNIKRDPMLKYFIFIPLLLSLVVKFLVPVVRDAFIHQFDLRNYYTLILSYFFIIMLPMLYGIIIGFMLLDEKDDGTLLAIQVSPLSTSKYVAYRLSIPMILSYLSMYLVFPIVDFYEVDIWNLTLVSILGAFWAPIMGLLLPTVANNKVEGFALMKIIGGLFIIPIIAWFIPTPWQYIFGIIPSYWPVKSFWVVTSGGNVYPYLLVGIFINISVLYILKNAFSKKVFI